MYYNLSCKRESTLQRILDYDPLLIIYTPLIVARWFPLRATLLLSPILYRVSPPALRHQKESVRIPYIISGIFLSREYGVTRNILITSQPRHAALPCRLGNSTCNSILNLCIEAVRYYIFGL